ncbi:hypothetical protein CYMTET_32370 [Cymbomonas tetramitiformis]|uniref:Uncharacterized protein n=1 Tax=Cymbomonas tetramitiformis TaxID=36881 RepID=A0AAE0KSA1_9CHLO|nr:hypothetical protein CYMTET_32370 [Cymbomonas tetramitiformis]
MLFTGTTTIVADAGNCTESEVNDGDAEAVDDDGVPVEIVCTIDLSETIDRISDNEGTERKAPNGTVGGYNGDGSGA